ncbi:MAG: hypothetical protein LBD08_00440 [Treponema sp.]|jgi:hypothetical protein|nr:hypothetical protein [Treponema sp.]
MAHRISKITDDQAEIIEPKVREPKVRKPGVRKPGVCAPRHPALRRTVFCLTLLLFIGGIPLGAQTASTNAGVSKKKDGAPQWLLDLWRADIVFFGSFPLTYFWSATFVDTYRASQHNWDARYLPWPAKSAGAVSMTEDEHIITIAAAAGGSLLAALIDHLIIRIRRARADKAASRFGSSEPIIIRKPWPQVPADEFPPGSAPETGPDQDAPHGSLPAGGGGE